MLVALLGLTVPAWAEEDGPRVRWAVLTQADWEREPTIRAEGVLETANLPNEVSLEVPLPQVDIPVPHRPRPAALRVHLPGLVPDRAKQKTRLQPSVRPLRIELTRQGRTGTLCLSAHPSYPEFAGQIDETRRAALESLATAHGYLPEGEVAMIGLALGHDPLLPNVVVLARLERTGDSTEPSLETWRRWFVDHAAAVARESAPSPDRGVLTLAYALATPVAKDSIRALAQRLYEGTRLTAMAVNYFPWAEASLVAGDAQAVADMERLVAKLESESGDGRIHEITLRHNRDRVLGIWMRVAVRTQNEEIRKIAFSKLRGAELADLLPLWLAVRYDQVEAPLPVAARFKLNEADSEVPFDRRRQILWWSALVLALVLGLCWRPTWRRIGGTLLVVVGLVLASLDLRIDGVPMRLEWAGYVYFLAGLLMLVPFVRSRLVSLVPALVGYLVPLAWLLASSEARKGLADDDFNLAQTAVVVAAISLLALVYLLVRLAWRQAGRRPT